MWACSSAAVSSSISMRLSSSFSDRINIWTLIAQSRRAMVVCPGGIKEACYGETPAYRQPRRGSGGKDQRAGGIGLRRLAPARRRTDRLADARLQFFYRAAGQD